MSTVTKNTRVIFFLICACIFLSSLGCDHPFEPLKENDRYNFSIYAILDLSADTQWVRVMPVRDSIFTTPEPIDATVTLIRESTGETEVLKDSLFLLPQGYYAWNYWTDTPLLPEEEYTIRAEASDGRFSQGTGSIPKFFTKPEINFNERDQRIRITIDSLVERLAVARINYHFIIYYDDGDPVLVTHYPVNHLQDVSKNIDGEHTLNLDMPPRIAEDLYLRPDQISIVDGQVTIVSADSNWPDSTGIGSDGSISLNVSSNVENGLGVVTGIVSKRLPLLE